MVVAINSSKRGSSTAIDDLALPIFLISPAPSYTSTHLDTIQLSFITYSSNSSYLLISVTTGTAIERTKQIGPLFVISISTGPLARQAN